MNDKLIVDFAIGVSKQTKVMKTYIDLISGVLYALDTVGISLSRIDDAVFVIDKAIRNINELVDVVRGTK